MSWQDWSLATKLVALMAVPTLVAVVLAVVLFRAQVSQSSSTEYQQVRTKITLQTRAVIGDLSTLRASVLGGNTPNKATNAALSRDVAALRRTVGDANLDGPARESYATASAALDKLRDANPSYSPATTALLGFQSVISKQVSAPELTPVASAVSRLDSAREEVARQQVLLDDAARGVGMTLGAQAELRASATRYDSDIEEFLGVSDAQTRGAYDAAMRDSDVASRAALVGSVLRHTPRRSETSGGVFVSVNASPDEVNAQSAATTAQFGRIGDRLANTLSTRAASLAGSASDRTGITLVLLFVALLIAVAIAVLIVRQLVGSLRTLRRGALDVANEALPRAVREVRDGRQTSTEVEPIAVHTREEVGQLARAFDEVHGEAVRLAAEQSQLRAEYGSLFVNLSRRSQTLVQRQLRLIERLERDEEDADQLDTLFQLDHLATRMRRNNENLIVLSGGDLGRGTGQTLAVADLLRAAASEIEQYQRVSVDAPEQVNVVGYAASDLVRVVAELLDNATAFSAPDTAVALTCTFVSDGSLRIAITDQGIGMTPADMDLANRQLYAARGDEMPAGRQMGLFVVGRLAAQYDVHVRLRSAPSGEGLCAEIALPPTLVSRTGTVSPLDAAPMPAPLAAPSGPESGMSGLHAQDTIPGFAPLSGSTAVPEALPLPRPSDAVAPEVPVVDIPDIPDIPEVAASDAASDGSALDTPLPSRRPGATAFPARYQPEADDEPGEADDLFNPAAPPAPSRPGTDMPVHVDNGHPGYDGAPAFDPGTADDGLFAPRRNGSHPGGMGSGTVPTDSAPYSQNGHGSAASGMAAATDAAAHLNNVAPDTAFHRDDADSAAHDDDATDSVDLHGHGHVDGSPDVDDLVDVDEPVDVDDTGHADHAGSPHGAGALPVNGLVHRDDIHLNGHAHDDILDVKDFAHGGDDADGIAAGDHMAHHDQWADADHAADVDHAADHAAALDQPGTADHAAEADAAHVEGEVGDGADVDTRVAGAGPDADGVASAEADNADDTGTTGDAEPGEDAGTDGAADRSHGTGGFGGTAVGVAGIAAAGTAGIAALGMGRATDEPAANGHALARNGTAPTDHPTDVAAGDAAAGDAAAEGSAAGDSAEAATADSTSDTVGAEHDGQATASGAGEDAASGAGLFESEAVTKWSVRNTFNGVTRYRLIGPPAAQSEDMDAGDAGYAYPDYESAMADEDGAPDEQAGDDDLFVPRQGQRRRTPIFDAMLSAWFVDANQDDQAPLTWPDNSAVAGNSAQQQGSWTPVDNGWRDAETVAQSEPTAFTGAGLPIRKRKARLVPGSITTNERPEPAPDRDPGQVRERYASLLRGLDEGRRELDDPAPDAVPAAHQESDAPAPQPTPRAADPVSGVGSGPVLRTPRPAPRPPEQAATFEPVTHPFGMPALPTPPAAHTPETPSAPETAPHPSSLFGGEQPDGAPVDPAPTGPPAPTGAAEQTPMGLPKRTRGAQLIPRENGTASTIRRDSEEVRDRFSSLQRGVTRGWQDREKARAPRGAADHRQENE